ncbi:peptidyl-prolyl cis-trans isomerase FKBP53 isoform X1 [Dendrobium catenatum]|uniref:peptidyl-prolyl cis-trans isomerase FKBP53 isoform X1 n=1 Tax=Dendrobium catenatum TaxID=906689 RepID=UPI0009F382CF|nr:peptidyl-prolyl cis-trans isomerase FKBP53 isoform X1 [Dendrobium catenatum]
MAFWGVEIRPSKPYIHNFDQSRGRLRISQATLGDGKSTSRSTMQCNVGDKSPVLLCSLIPNVSETCHLELEFEEDGEVIFSVLGQRSIHLTGYYLGHGRSLDGDDTESYGEDIAESDASDSYSYGSEDDYESDFIDDADVAIYSESRRPKSSVVIEEIEDDEKQHRNFRRLKKKHEISDSEDVEMGSQQLVVRNKGSTKEESEDDDGFPICFTEEGTISKKKKSDDKKRKVNGSTQDTVSVSKANTDRDSRMPAETASKHNEKSKKKKENDEKRSIGSENEEKQNKHKENVNVENNSETDTNLSKEIEGHAKESLNGVKDTDKSGDPDACKQSKKKSKKRRISEGASDEQDSFMEDIDADKIPKEDKMTVDEPAATDVNVTKKKKKSKKKNKDSDIKHEALAKEKADLAVNGVDELKQGSQAIKTRTFPNGLIVEEVSMGKPDGKKASPGKKVSVRYIGKLKSGTIFDSNIGQKPFKFRLGIGEVIKGWDIGVSGMCVGDKRRLTIPPSFGYGAKGVGKIPPNSWLVFDVELVDVQ